MSGADLTRLLVEALYLVLLVSGPPLLVSLAVGLAVGLGQAMTQVQEQTLTFVPKLVAVGLVVSVLGGWMGAEVVRFTSSLWGEIPRLVQTR
jgi:flagellar biosynthetic protein FliQ